MRIRNVMKRWSISTTPVTHGGGRYIAAYFPDLSGWDKPRRIIWLSLN